MKLLPRSRFTRNLLYLNSSAMQGFNEWIFVPGMLFGSRIAWWNNKATRKTLHEGLDICFYRDQSGNTCSLKSGTVIPALFAGLVVRIDPDYLGKSLYTRIDTTSGEGHIYVIFGHTEPLPGVTVGMRYKEGEAIALIADAGVKQSRIPSHLHVTIAVVPPSLPPAELCWDMMTREYVDLLDPLMVIDGPFTVLSE